LLIVIEVSKEIGHVRQAVFLKVGEVDVIVEFNSAALKTTYNSP
jgi:hypothetical protein